MVTVPNSRPIPFDLPSNVSKIALLMIDFQGDFCDPTQSFIAAMGGATEQTPKALQPAANVLAASRKAGIRIIHTLEAHSTDLSDLTVSKDARSRVDPNRSVIGAQGGNGRMLTRGSPCNGLMPEVAFVDGDIAIHKPGKGAFCDTELRARLDGVTHLLFCGVTTECCVQTTMREANDRGFTSLIVVDATASCVPEFHTQTVEQVTAFGAIVGCAASSADVVTALKQVEASASSQGHHFNNNNGIPTSLKPPLSLPVIDVRHLVKKLAEPFAPARRAADQECLDCASQIDRACREIGFFYVVGHGIQPPLDRAKQLFDLDLSVKLRLQASAGEGAGYEPSGAQVLDEGRLGDGIDGEVTLGDRKESYIVGKSAPSQRLDHGDTIEGRWPEEGETSGGNPSGRTVVPEGFRSALVEYHDSCETFLRTLMRGAALGLGLAADTFDCFTKDAMTKVRLLRYPSPETDLGYSKGAHGCGAHQDWGAFTLLAQDDVGGLEVYCDGKWLSAPNKDGALLVNVGDMMKLWTGERYRSAPHRVVKPSSERHSIAVFYNCDHDAPIDPRLLMPNKVVEATGLTLTAEEYILERVKETYKE